jgi:Family of unknown function (DUF6459)
MSLPALRLRPIPVTEPQPALRVVPDVDPSSADPQQTLLPLELVLPPRRSPGIAATEPAPRGFALRFTQAALEVTTGLRPPAQLQAWTSDDVHATLQHRHAAVLRSSARPRRFRVRSVHVATPQQGVAEVAAVVSDGVRYRAVAFRMEGRDQRWRVTALQLG